MYISSILGGLIILGIYYKNMYNTAYLPINSSSAWTNNATSYDVQAVITDNKFDEAKYQQYSPPFYTAGYILTVGANFAFYPVYFLYITFNQWTTVSGAYKDFWAGLRKGKGNYEGAMDVHSRVMARYPEVPDWWFLVILLAALVLSIVFLKVFPLDTPVWLTFLLIGINLVFAVPLSFLSATTGTNLGLGSLIQVITGFLLPGNYNAYLYGQTLGSWALAGKSESWICQILPFRAVWNSLSTTSIVKRRSKLTKFQGYSDNYVQDQKMAHYSKIPPRAVFRSQIGTIIITCFVAVGTQDFIMNDVEGLCTADQPQKFTCANDGAPMYSNSLMWGVLGSNRMFNDMYPLFKWCFLIGFAVAVIFLVPQYYGPIYLPGVRERLRQKLRPRTFERLDRTVFPFVASLLWLNPILIIQGIQHWAPSNLSYKTPGMIL